MKTFFHGHSFTGNPVGCAAALSSLDLLEKEDRIADVKRIEEQHRGFAKWLEANEKVEHTRILGTVIAFNIKTEEQTGYFNKNRDWLYQNFLERGVLLRPLGNVVYILPPYCITNEELEKIYSVIKEVISLIK